ncbi:latrophilin/CL-like GPS domain protein (macronuclear) [Tetrahymena thermophila SB210]|uniref:Latrophilin/CL-like GPS domain protein n=1 Tax=Tetrahymena thermophila (strain SB210) TaxID=312017 RepID=I7LUZ0_TETTS|nr:latrophilin/CL-like GPS domain protein [Tetrahymena thermophila SB210]EAR96334.2 latrophilin/CL-like GPS domain protein [Tetrahymena thermophila SB210]|eukprot:XP_001016579.2 latrophilin/CL-like GPS domain protein [Tetrahymena thermophila SB210]
MLISLHYMLLSQQCKIQFTFFVYSFFFYIKFSCRSCQQGFYLKDYSCVTSCPPLKYQQLSKLGICKPCPFPCDECTLDGQSCLTCQAGYVLTMARQCQLSCWEQQYVDQNNVCQSCDTSCLSCSGPKNTDCTQCNLGYFKEAQSGACLPCNPLCLQCTDQTNLSCSLCQYGVIFYNNSICTLDCSEIPGTYAYDDSCLPCNSQCKSCDGPDFSDCLVCQDGFTLLNNLCVPCDSKCLRCFGTTSEQCYSCTDGYVLQEKSCVLSCNPGYYLQNKICKQCNQACSLCFGPQNNQCTACSQGFYFKNNLCLPCHPFCQNCFGPNQDNCLFCNPGSFLMRTQCYSNQQGGCPKGYYGNMQTGLCSLCDPSCLACQGSSPNVCLSCPQGSYMTQLFYDISGNTLPSSCSPCPSVCQICTSATLCIQCQPNYFLYMNTCLSTCPNGFYGSNVTGMCTPCGNNCTTCSGFNSLGNFICNSCTTSYYLDSNFQCQQCSAGCVLCKSQTVCIKCLQGYYNYQGFCLTQCPVGYYASDSTQSCVQCVKPCSLCTSSTMCQACQIGYYLQSNYNSSKVLVSSSCMMCNNVCNDCSAGTASDCMSCKSPLSLQGNQCQQQCNIGYYSNQGICLLCSQNCLQCTSASYCTVCAQGYISIQGVCQLCNFKCSSCFGLNETQCYSCVSPYYLYQSTCQLTCPDQFFKQTLTDSQNVQHNICQKCSSSCFNCFGIGDNQCTSCLTGYYVTSSKTCSQCSQLCNTCSQDSTLCTSCPLGQFLYNQTCVQTCPPGFYGSDQDNKCHQCNSPCSTCTGPGVNQCSSCLQSYFYSQGQCLPCHPNCKTCYGFLQNQCYTCQLGMQQQSNTCTSCGDGNYYDSLLNSCQQCNPVCLTCYGASSSNCLSCQSGKYLYQSTCNICPSSCSSCSSQNMCTSCANNFYLLALSSSNQICVQSCPQGMVENLNQQCQCSNNCNLCTIDPDSLLVTCTKCSAQNFVIDLFTQGNQFACIDGTTCQGFLDIQSNSCVQSCSSTTPFVDFVAKQCIQNSCPQNTVILYISGQGQCLSACPKGYYANNQQICSPCHPLCSKCTGPQPNQCQECVQKIFYHPVISTCSDSCLIGYNLDSVSGYCVVCYNFCKACISNLVLFNGLCLEECPVGYTQTASMTCVESSNEVVKILNSFNSAIGITKDVVLQASLFVLGPIKSIEWVLKKCTDAQFQASFDILTINTLTLTIPFLALKSSQSYTFRIEVILASNEILNDEVSFMTAGEIIAGSFIVNPTSGTAGSDIFQISIQNYKFPQPLLFDISYFVLQVQFSNTIADDGSIQKQTNPSFVKVGLVQIYESIPFNQTQASLLTYQFPIYYESDQNIACEIKIYSADGSSERYDYSIITLKKTVKVDQSIFKFNSQNVFDSISFLNYILNIRESFVIDSKKLKALQQNNNINMQIALSNKKTYNQNAQCDPDIDCFGQGSCVMSLNLYSCQCLEGYLGVNCQWQQSDYIFLQANIPQYIQYILSQNTTKYSSIIVAQAIGNVFYYSDFNDEAIQLANVFISILTSSLNNVLDQIQIQIYQTICQNLITILQNTQAQQASSQIQQLQVLNQNIQSATFQNINMGESLTQQSDTSDSAAIPLSLQMINTSNTNVNGSTPQGRRQLRRLQKLQKIRLLQSSSDSNSAIPVVFRSLTVQIPPQVIDTSKKVIVSGSSFKVDPRANPFAVTTTLSLSLGGNGGAQSVSDAPKPIVMTIPKKVPSPPGLNTDAIQCTYYDEETNSYKSDGCTLVKETITSIICSCTHLTDFSAALQPQSIKSVINLSDMKEAQKVGNSLLSASNPAVITISNLPTPKIGQRNVNLVNAVNIQLSGGVLNVLAKQTFIVTQDGENYSTYSMWDYIQQDSVQNLISSLSNNDEDTVSQSSNRQLGQIIIIGVLVVGVFFKTGIRASFKFKFLDDDEAPAEMILNNIHKNVKNGNQQDEQNNDQEKDIQFYKEKDKEYDFSITQSHNNIKSKSNPNTPKDLVKISIQDEVAETLSNFSPAHGQGRVKLTRKAIDEVTKKALQLKKKYEQEQKLLKIIEKNQEANSQENQSNILDLQSQIKQEQEKMFESQNLSPKKLQKSPFTPFKKSQFVKQTIDQSPNNQNNSNTSRNKSNSQNKFSKFSEKIAEIQDQQSPQRNEKKYKIDSQPRMVFQKVNLVIQEQDLQSIDSTNQQQQKKKKGKKSKSKAKNIKKNEKIEKDDKNEEIMLTTEANDDQGLIKDKFVKQQASPNSANVVKKSKFCNQSTLFNQKSKSPHLVKSINLKSQQNSPRSKHNIKNSPQSTNKIENKISNFSNQLKIQGLRESNLQMNLSQQQQQEIKEKNELIENELAILKMRENVQKQKQKISSNNINPIYSIFHAKDTLFQTKMSRIIYVYITFYGYLAFDFYIYKWCSEHTPNQPFINYLFYFNPARILLIIMLSNIVSHTFFGFLNQIFSSFIRQQDYELINTKILNRLRAQHLTCYIFIFLCLFAIYSSTVNSFAQTQYFTVNQIQDIIIEVVGAFLIDIFIFDLFLVIFHSGFVSTLPEEIPFKRNFEIFQSQRGFFYTQNTEHPKVMDIII